MAAVVAAGVGAPIGVWASWAATGDLSVSTGVNWFLRNACGILVPAAAALAVIGARERLQAQGWREALTAESRRGAVGELVAAVLATVVIGAVVLETPEQIPVTYLMMGSAAWVGFRFTPAVGALYTLGFGTLAVLLTLAGLGPFGAIEDLVLRANSIQLFVALTTLLVLLLSNGVTSRAVLATQLRQAEVRATARADLLDAVNGAMVDGLCVSDSWGHVLLANSAAAVLGGADERGAHVHDASGAEWYWPDGTEVDPEDLPHARALRGEVVPLSDVVRRDTATGHEKVLAVSAVPLHFGMPDAEGVAETGPLAVVLMRDVSWQRAQQRAQENFVAVAAHDLKGPLSGVLSWAELTRDQLASGDTTELVAAGQSVERIYRTASRMTTLITDLLDYTVASSAQLHVRAIDLDELVDSIAADLERPRDGVVIEHRQLGVAAADALLMRQLFGNLIANAVKYVGPGESPRLRIESRELDGVLEVSVSDNGVGIPEGDRSKIFDTFFRSDTTTGFPGSGLGLAICRRAVERHDGWIAAREGPDGVGTTIVFTLPMGTAEEAGDDGVASEVAPPGATGDETIVGQGERFPDVTA